MSILRGGLKWRGTVYSLEELKKHTMLRERNKYPNIN